MPATGEFQVYTSDGKVALDTAAVKLGPFICPAESELVSFGYVFDDTTAVTAPENLDLEIQTLANEAAGGTTYATLLTASGVAASAEGTVYEFTPSTRTTIGAGTSFQLNATTGATAGDGHVFVKLRALGNNSSTKVVLGTAS